MPRTPSRFRSYQDPKLQPPDPPCPHDDVDVTGSEVEFYDGQLTVHAWGKCANCGCPLQMVSEDVEDLAWEVDA